MSTESRVDLSHSQPFWAHGLPDLGSRTQRPYHQLSQTAPLLRTTRAIASIPRMIPRLSVCTWPSKCLAGSSFAAALQSSLRDFDGSFSYLAATADSLGFVKDPFGFKPLVVPKLPPMLRSPPRRSRCVPPRERIFRSGAGVKQVQTWHVECSTLRSELTERLTRAIAVREVDCAGKTYARDQPRDSPAHQRRGKRDRRASPAGAAQFGSGHLTAGQTGLYRERRLLLRRDELTDPL